MKVDQAVRTSWGKRILKGVVLPAAVSAFLVLGAGPAQAGHDYGHGGSQIFWGLFLGYPPPSYYRDYHHHYHYSAPYYPGAYYPRAYYPSGFWYGRGYGHGRGRDWDHDSDSGHRHHRHHPGCRH
jgi:hypothetical protein